MSKRSPFRYFRTSPEISRLAVMLYVRFPLSLRSAERHDLPSKAAPIIRKAMLGHEDEEGWVALSGVGNRILNIAPDFDPRSFSHAKLSALVEKSGAFEMKRLSDKNFSIRVRAADKAPTVK